MYAIAVVNCTLYAVLILLSAKGGFVCAHEKPLVIYLSYSTAIIIVSKHPTMNSNHIATGYYATDGGIAPLFSCGGKPLAPSFLTGNGSHVALWTSVLIHVVALAFNTAANLLFFVASDSSSDFMNILAIMSLALHATAVIGTVVSTGFIKDVFAMPLFNTVGAGLFFMGFAATGVLANYHFTDSGSDTGENICYMFSLIFQAFACFAAIA